MNSDAEARRRALDPACSFIVQAPAGSGKTELLTQRYLRLLAGVEQPEQILAITFTRKAAAEMRNRILLALREADASRPPEEHKRTTWDLAAAARQQDQRRGWQLVEHSSRLRIQTIDALNASLARRLPILSGTGAALEPAKDAQPLYEAAIVRLIERLGDGSMESSCLETLVIHLGNRLDRLEALLCDLLAKRDQWLHPLMNAVRHQDLRGVLELTLVELIERHLGELCTGLPTALRGEMWILTNHAAANLLQREDLPPERRALLESCRENATAALGSGAYCLQAWLAVAEVFLTRDQQLYRSVSVKQGFPPQDAAMKSRMKEALAALAENGAACAQLAALSVLPTPCYSDAQWRVLQALLVVLPLVVAELQLVFQEQGKADYLECALRALQALGSSEEPTDLALAFDYRLRHLLVDECQDTSFAQLDLLERLTAGWAAGDGRTLFCVGDPMQSIYRFRQAEVGLFLQLQRHGLRSVQLEPLQLSANFRSVRPLVEWVNQVFPSVLSPRDDPEQGAVKYSPSLAASADAALPLGRAVAEDPGVLQCWQGGVHVHAALDEEAPAQALRVVNIVRQTQCHDRAGSIAVLVTARSHVRQIAAALSAASIDFQAVEIEPLDARPVVQDLIALTRALLHLGDRTAWLAVLRAPWCGLTLADLHALVGMDRDSTINELLARARQDGAWPAALGASGRARLERVHAVLHAALQERGRTSLRNLVERTWNSLYGPACLERDQDLDDALAFLERLEQIEVAGDLADVARLDEQLQSLFARPRDESGAGEPASPVPGRVELMTIHKAKGLEFDTVILPELHRRVRGQAQELLLWARVADHDGIVFAPAKAHGAQADPMYRWIDSLERARSARERARLLYVAATRARRTLHLLGSVQSSQGDLQRHLTAPAEGSMLRLLWGALRSHFEALTPSPSPSSSASLPAAPRKALRRLPLSWQAPVADVPLRNQAPAVADSDTTALEFDWATETARHVGTLVHREVERLVRNARPDEAVVVSPVTSARLAVELVELGVPPPRSRAAAGRVIEAIENILADARGRWLLGLGEPIREAESELALSGVMNGRVISSIIDRTFVDARGVRWIVDFKTSTHEGGQLAAFLDSEVERYRPQLHRYVQLMRGLHPGQPVRAALYFPLLRQWREVEA